MRRIKKRNLNTIRIKRDAYVGNVKDEEVIVEETVDITPERVTMEEKTEPVCADVAADVENSVEEAETEAEAAEEKAEADVAEETAPVEEVESVEEPVEEEAESVEEPATEEIAEETAETTEEVVEDTVTITPDEVVFDEEEKPVAESEEADVEESVLESEAGESAEEPAEEEVVEDTVTITPDEVVFDEEEKPVAESEETDVEEAVLEAEAEETETAEAAEDAADAVEEVTEEVEEVPLEASEEESEEILDEEGSLDGTEAEVKELAQAEETEVEEPEAEAVEETAEKVETEEVEEPEAVEETATEETETAEEEKPAEKTEKEVFKLTTPANQDDILSRICVKRGRKLIYRPNEIIFNCTAAVTGTDKNNEEGIKIKSILDEEIKQGVKLGYIDKYDGLKMSEIKEEYENDVVYEYAEQEFKRVGLVLDGEKVKVYVYDWDMKALHHIGFVDQANVADLKPYLEDKEKYSFDVCGLITGGKFRKVIKDEATGKVTVEKGNDGKLGVELDISVINRKD